jgi:hypothetical protein
MYCIKIIYDCLYVYVVLIEDQKNIVYITKVDLWFYVIVLGVQGVNSLYVVWTFLLLCWKMGHPLQPESSNLICNGAVPLYQTTLRCSWQDTYFSSSSSSLSSNWDPKREYQQTTTTQPSYITWKSILSQLHVNK